MFRVGIIGSENSHAKAFTDIFNASGKYDDIQVVAIWGEEEEASKKISETYNVPIMKPEEMLGKVDAIMVTSRNGKLHPIYARPFIEQGLPAFLDKPIANCSKEAEAIIALAREKGAPVMGGSSTKAVPDTLELKAIADAAKAEGKLLGGHVFAPVSMVNEYGNFYFYSSHLAEIALTIFGYHPVAVQAVKTQSGVTAILEYEDYAVGLSYTEGAYRYGATVLSKDGAALKEISIADCYEAEVAHFVHMLRTGEVPQCDHDIYFPVKVLNAIEKAYTEGGRQVIG